MVYGLGADTVAYGYKDAGKMITGALAGPNRVVRVKPHNCNTAGKLAGETVRVRS